MKRLLLASMLALTCVSASASSQSTESLGTRVGLGQDTARDPAQIKNLRLSDPLVQQKYLNEPDMLRFLRGTYSEACTRGLVKNAADNIRLDRNNRYSAEQRKTAQALVESNRIWKMTSLEMEALYGKGYLTAANYCDCLMKEVTDQELVNPKKGLESIRKIAKPVLTACSQTAKDETARQLSERKQFEEQKK